MIRTQELMKILRDEYEKGEGLNICAKHNILKTIETKMNINEDGWVNIYNPL